MQRPTSSRGLRPFAAVLLLAMALPAAAQEPAEPAFELTTDVLSRYVWRGYDLSHADPTLVTSLAWSPEFAPGLWLKVDLLGALRKAPELGDGSNSLDELDVSLGWEKDDLAGGRLTLGVALYFYGYTSTWTRDVAYEDDSDLEASVYLSWKAAEHLRPTLEYYRGLDDAIRGDYVEAGLAFPFEGRGWSTEPVVTAGWSSQYDVPGRLTNVTATVPLSIRLGRVTVTPAVLWTWVEDPESFNPEELTGETPREVLFQATVRLSWSF